MLTQRTTIQTSEDWRHWLARDHPTIRDQLHEWLALNQESRLGQDTFDNCEIRESEIAVLLRSRTNCVADKCFVIAAIRLPEQVQHKGWFKSFLTECCKVNPWSKLIIEDVDNPNLRNFLESLNSVVLNDFFKTTYVVPKANVLRLNAEPLLPYKEYLSRIKKF